MDEDQYQQYLNAVDRLDSRLGKEVSEPVADPYREQLRDEESGFRVPGCYRVKPYPMI